MADFFDTLGAAAKRAAGSMTAELQIAAEEQKIRDCYRNLGRLYFRASRTGRSLTGADFKEECMKVEASLKRINQLKRDKNVSNVYADEEDFVTVD